MNFGTVPHLLGAFLLLLTTSSATKSGNAFECVAAINNLANDTLQSAIDACGKVNSGIQTGNILNFGDYTQCSHLKDAGLVYALQAYFVPEIAKVAEKLATEYQEFPMIALCMPAACTYNESGSALYVKTVIDRLGYTLIDAVQLPFLSAPLVSKYTSSMDWRAIMTVVLLALLTLVAMIGAVVSTGGIPGVFLLKQHGPSPKWLEIMRCFSLTDNLWSLCDTSQRFSQTSALEGARVLSMQWVVVGHVYVFLISNVSNVLFLHNVALKRWTTVLTLGNATVSVDSFFVISGFLLGLIMTRKLRGRASLSPLRRCRQFGMFIVHRWLRLSPGLAVVMLVQANLVPYVGDGPRWSLTMANQDSCYKYWWTNLLYINNLHPRNDEEECVAQSWYLANDFQFFVFSLPLLVVFRDWPLLRDRLWARCGVLLAFIAASVGCRMVVVSIYDMTISTYGLAQGHDSKSARIAGDLYIQPEYRYASYGIGVLVGVLVDHWNAQKEASADLALEQGEYAALAEELEAPEEDAMTTKFASTKVICACTPRLGKYGVGFVVAMGLMVLDLMAVYQPETGHGRSFTKVENVLYLGGLRALWSGAFAFLIVGCAMGGLPLVNKMLSLPIYIPFSKLSYGVYLIHITFLDVFIYSDQYMKWYQDQLMVFYYLGILFCSYVLSALLYVLVDAPVANLEAKLLGRE
ncbi:hypothetical protein CYMTET_4248 [Cymbomonas tetramitiformis]|uniref:Acyltransferase 3 domain-containing protein n=1 Tax=Cymbomonas tetramitiformis TaxID=36881 RepID=A0AAE0H3C0_9CHLO|nr:hypothetical protein CYMTET_4248 [Cymbomonas tetramitiformis]|eukprot:gene23709-28735_t